ncbi:MAG: hypothetical protein ABUL67_00810 [Haliangium ochraceum]
MSNETLALLTAISSIVQGVGTIFVAAAFVVSRRQLSIMREEVHQNRISIENGHAIDQMSQYQGALQLMFDWRSELIANPDLAEGFRDEPFFAEAFKLLPEQQYFHTVKLFHIFEHFWLLNSRKIIHEDIWKPWSRNIILLMRQKKKRAIWDLLKKIGIFNVSFVSFVDDEVQAMDARESRAGAGPRAPRPEPEPT